MVNYVNLDKVSANAVTESIVAQTDLQQGQFVALGNLQEDGEIREVTVSADQSKQLAIHVSDALVYEDEKTELDFILKTGSVGRAYHPHRGMILSISKDAIGGAVSKGAIVVPDTAKAMKVDATATTGIRAEVIALESDAFAGDLAVIQFL